MASAKSVHPPLELEWETVPSKPVKPADPTSERDKLLDKLRQLASLNKERNRLMDQIDGVADPARIKM